MLYRGSQLRTHLESQQRLWSSAQCCYCLEHGERLKLDSMHFALGDDHELLVVWSRVSWFDSEMLPSDLSLHTWVALLKDLECLGGSAQISDVSY